MNSDGNIQLINNSDKDSGNTLQLSSRATGKNQKSTVSDCIITTILKRKEYDVLSSINIIQVIMRFISWNIDSLNAALTSDSNRAVLTRKVIATMLEKNPDVIALQETKLPEKGLSKKHIECLEILFKGYTYKWRSSKEPARKGYAGTMFLYKDKYTPEVDFPEIEAPDTMDFEGRIMTLDFGAFYLTQVYTPNAGDGLRRLKERQVWDVKYAKYLQKLDKIKPVLATGDYNVAHNEIDLANPQSNHMSAGFTDEEREGFTNLLSKGFTDTFRYVHGDVRGVYSWWAQRVKTSKINNAGWRIDYWLVSNRLADRIIKSEILDSGDRQDHAPTLLDIELEPVVSNHPSGRLV